MDVPIFPLNLVLFPGRALPLRIFESRYKTMLNECLERDRTFGVVSIRRGSAVSTEWSMCGTDQATLKQRCATIHRVGTLAHIVSVKSASNEGIIDVTTRGSTRFTIDELYENRPFLTADVTMIDEPEGDDPYLAADGVHREIRRFLELTNIPIELCDRLPRDPAALSYLAASALGIEIPRQQTLLEVPDHATRLRRLAEIVRTESDIFRHFGQLVHFRPPSPRDVELN